VAFKALTLTSALCNILYKRLRNTLLTYHNCKCSPDYSTFVNKSRAVARKPRNAACFPTPKDSSTVFWFRCRKVKAVRP